MAVSWLCHGCEVAVRWLCRGCGCEVAVLMLAGFKSHSWYPYLIGVLPPLVPLLLVWAPHLKCHQGGPTLIQGGSLQCKISSSLKFPTALFSLTAYSRVTREHWVLSAQMESWSKAVVDEVSKRFRGVLRVGEGSCG